MKKKILPMFFLLSLAMGLCIAVSGCSALKLKAPANLRVSDDGFLSWDEVDGAAAYRVFINDGVSIRTKTVWIYSGSPTATASI